MFMAAVIISPIYARWPEYRRWFQWGGMITAGIALICSAFVTAPWQLIVFIGILHPLGASTVYCRIHLPPLQNAYDDLADAHPAA